MALTSLRVILRNSAICRSLRSSHSRTVDRCVLCKYYNFQHRLLQKLDIQSQIPCRLYFSSPSGLQNKHYNTPLFLRAHDFLERTALLDQNGSYTYSDILFSANKLTDRILQICDNSKDDVHGVRVAMLCPNDVSYVISQWATWISGGVVVPLSAAYPEAELEYFITDSGCSLIIVTEDMADRVDAISQKYGVPLLVLKKEDYLSKDDEFRETEDFTLERDVRRYNRQLQLQLQHHYKKQDALIVYTSGTTGRPKGVLHTHGSISMHMAAMVRSWSWLSNDVILHALPLHHLHGIINALMTPLSVGATCVMMPKFDAEKVWARLLAPPIDDLGRRVNLFMGVPTMYSRLIEQYDLRFNRGRGTKRARDYIRATCSNKIRLMVSGSAALPESVMSRWEQITGHQLLERFGMSEIGMALTNPLKGKRIAGSVGNPFPGVQVCIAKPNVYASCGYDIIASGNQLSTKVTPGCEDEPGELYVKGPHLFKAYWGRPTATAEAYTKDGWFKTGDTVRYTDGAYSIMGRTSVDIIKSGGYKLSALEIERHLLVHPDITDVAVVGLPDVTWGQRVAAVVVLRKDAPSMILPDLTVWCADQMANYKRPSVLKVVPTIPRNAMGKVNKKELVTAVFSKHPKL